MTSTTTSGPVTASPEAVAGLRLATDREREVEHDLLLVAEALVRHGVTVTWVTTHRTVTALGVACSAAITAATDDTLLAGYLDVVARGEVGGILATGHRHDTDADHHADLAAAARVSRTEGRAVWFPGHDALGEHVTVGDLLASTAIDRVEVLGGGRATPDVIVQTRGFVRPRFSAGELVLHTQPARGGVLVPFETPTPTPCCADHS